MVAKKSDRRLPPTYPKSPTAIQAPSVAIPLVGLPRTSDRSIPLSTSHTNLVLMDTSSSDFSESGTPTSLEVGRRTGITVSIDPSLVALLYEGFGSPLNFAEPILQGIKAVLDTYSSKSHLSDWNYLLDDNARSLFESLGGWKALVLKLHQAVAAVLLPVRKCEQLSNAWETTVLLEYIDQIKVNPTTVQSSLKMVDNLAATVPVMEWTLTGKEPSPLRIDLQVLWYSVQCLGRFDEYLYYGIVANQLKAVTDESTAALDLFEAGQFRHRLFSEKYEWYLLMLSQQGGGVSAILRDIEEDLLYANFNPSDVSARKRIEKLLVQMTGHSQVRSEAVVMLNRFYNTHQWEIENVQLVSLGSDLLVQTTEDSYWVEFVGLAMTPGLPERSPLVRCAVFANATVSLGTAIRCGFYDWRLVSESGNKTVQTGRILVQAGTNVQICKLLMDEVGTSFETAASSLPDIAQLGFNAVHLEGVAARNNGAVWTTPEGELLCDRPQADFRAITDRASPSTYLGGREEFANLVLDAKKIDLLSIVDIPLHVSAARKHRKYRDQALTVLSGHVKQMAIEGELCLLNYRLAETWDTLVADILSWPTEFGVGGICLLGGPYPPLWDPNLTELLRTDTDGEPHYSFEDILSAKVIDPKSAMTTDSKFFSAFLGKIVREIFSKFPRFLILVPATTFEEAQWLQRSGVVPMLTGLAEMTHERGPVALSELVQKNCNNMMGISSSGSILPAKLLGRARAPFTDLMFTLPSFPVVRWGELECLADMHPMMLDDFGQEAATTPPLPNYFASESVQPVAPLVVTPDRRPSYSLDAVDVGGGAIELDPANCMAHYARLAQMRRQRSKILHSSNLVLVPVDDPQIIAYVRHGDKQILAVVNFGPNDSWVKLKLKNFAEKNSESDLFPPSVPPTLWAGSELALDGIKILVPGYSSVFKIFKSVSPSKSALLWSSLQRKGSYFRDQFRALVCEATDCGRLKTVIEGLAEYDENLAEKITENLTENEMALFVAKLDAICYLSPSPVITAMQQATKLRPILFSTPELGKWSTAGGLGVMVDDLANTMATGGPEIWVCSPYYERNRKGETGYLARDGIVWKFNMDVNLGTETVTVGVHEGRVHNVRHFFVHNAKYFPSIYPDFSASEMTAFLTLLGKCPLEICCKLGAPFPSTIVTNDWATGLTAAFGKNPYFFGSVFEATKFMHIVHNLDQNYEGRIFPKPDENLGAIHQLATDLLVDPHWQKMCVNPSRCAILASDNWGTVSLSYRRELLEGSALAPLLRRHAAPFAHPNGIPLATRLERLEGLGTHWEAKMALQRKFFPNHINCENTVLFGFVGRITFQKGIHLILDIAESLLKRHSGKVQIMLCGMSNPGEAYSVTCAHRMKELTWRFPNNFWADPDAFFTDGPLVNLGADFGLMPSAFEPGGIVQQEFMVAGTPVIAFKTGGLRDTITEFIPSDSTGNGFTFEAHTGGDLAYAIERALKLFTSDRTTKYMCLRANARKSVITCDMVAKAWMKEFYRMNNKGYYDPQEVNAISQKAAWNMEQSLSDTSSDEEETEDTDESVDNDTVVPSPIGRIQSLSAISRSSSSSVRRSVRIAYKPNPLGDVPRSVLLAGSFDQWASRIPLKWDKQTRHFYLDIRMPEGKWFVKLIVDGCWICAPDYPTETDIQGNRNNVILVD